MRWPQAGTGVTLVPWGLAPGTNGAPWPAPRALTALGQYLVEPTALPGEEALAALLSDTHPALVVMDIEACRRLGGAALWRLHRRYPAVRMLLAWPAPAHEWLPWLHKLGAAGAVPRVPDADLWPRAFDAVLDGELWLPREVLHWMHDALMNEHAADADIAEAGDGPTELTPREAEAMACMRLGLTNREIGERLGVSINTVKKHLASAYAKLGIRARRQVLATSDAAAAQFTSR